MSWWAASVWAGMVPIQGGSYLPLYPPDPEHPEAEVASFQLDTLPTTRGEFAQFVTEHPEWQRGNVPPILADERYLKSWVSPTTPDGDPRVPVTEVSWFAARAYCEARGARLPTSDEWEYVARASPKKKDATMDDDWLALTLSWYSKPRHSAPSIVGQRPANAWGVYDMHGLIWEWVEDFNNTIFGTDSREGGDENNLRFCGAGALSATDVRDYATFMRIAYRSSLKGKYTTRALGFRCAADLEK